MADSAQRRGDERDGCNLAASAAARLCRGARRPLPTIAATSLFREVRHCRRVDSRPSRGSAVASPASSSRRSATAGRVPRSRCGGHSGRGSSTGRSGGDEIGEAGIRGQQAH
ncbi:hypothetical protein E2562_005151 [Oryza meyeriana var. granulata]|uniref:Uncharacterized protein n=1 Tax=Oryza meyeriana var. granulata TaxID=110450 RepID=A0A6G1BUH3_9ORYZ|nr:hypothetical protein E2562_005151 [Oryza meyeriana var. granulata]